MVSSSTMNISRDNFLRFRRWTLGSLVDGIHSINTSPRRSRRFVLITQNSFSLGKQYANADWNLVNLAFLTSFHEWNLSVSIFVANFKILVNSSRNDNDKECSSKTFSQVTFKNVSVQAQIRSEVFLKHSSLISRSDILIPSLTSSCILANSFWSSSDFVLKLKINLYLQSLFYAFVQL
jgi:hypothetical protein